MHQATQIASQPHQLVPPHARRLSQCKHRPFTAVRAVNVSTNACSSDELTATATVTKRQLLSGTTALAAAVTLTGSWQCQPATAQSLDDDFTVTSSGLKILDVRPGEGASPQPGDRVAVHWSGYTKGYQVSWRGNRITSPSSCIKGPPHG